jgi:hypothetical protein
MELINLPLTSLMLVRLLGGKTDDITEKTGKENAESTLQVHDARLLVVDDIEINLLIAEETLLS